MTDPKSIAVAYYVALGEKKLEEVKKFIHPEIQFSDPMEKVIGKEPFLQAAKKFSSVFKTLTIREQFGSENRAVIVYEVEIPTLPKKILAVSLLGFKEGLIASIELIYDTRNFLPRT